MDEALTIASWNILNSPTFTDRWPAVSRIVSGLGADVVCLQEVSTRADVGALARECGFPRHASTRFQRPDDGWREILAIFSRWPIVDADPIETRSGVTTCLRATIAAPAGEIDVYTVHLHPRDSAIRAAETAVILTEIEGRSQPAIVCGDFNATPAGSTLRGFFATFVSAFERANGEHPGSTFGTPLFTELNPGVALPVAALDHILVREGEFAAKSVTRIGDPVAGTDGYPSDHWGLCAELSPVG